MVKGQVYDYYRFGYNYCLLRTGVENDSYDIVKSSINEYLKDIEGLSLKVTLSIVKHELIRFRDTFPDKNEIISADDHKKLQGILDRADAALDSELNLTQVFMTTPKKLDIDKLYKGGMDFISINAQTYMSRQARLDYRYGCRCISLQVSTAAAFHLMRSLEECVKELYFSYFRTNRLPNNQLMWGQMINALKNKARGSKPKKDLLDNLDMFRRNYRNPTQHPEKNYNIEEAQNLLFSAIVVLSEIYSDTQVIKHSKKEDNLEKQNLT